MTSPHPFHFSLADSLENRLSISRKVKYVDERSFLPHSEQKIIVFLVGLPARGKSYISKKLRRYLRWIGYNTQLFHVGAHRRAFTSKISVDINVTNFFDPNDESKTQLRDRLAMDTLEGAITFLQKNNGHVAIHDATNSTKARRDLLLSRVSKETDINVLWIESICTDESLIEENIKLKLHSPDYKDMSSETARVNLIERIKMYESSYDTLNEQDNDKSYIKLIDLGRQVLANNIHGYLQSQIVTYLMNSNMKSRPIWISRHGESMAHVQGGILGGDSELSTWGHRYAGALAKFFDAHNLNGIEIWTSTLLRALQTSSFIETKASQVMRISALNEIFAGACEGMTYQQIEEQMHDEYIARQVDKLRYRYPRGGESYLDVVGRLKPLIIELERKTEAVFIVSHQAVLRTLIGYWINCSKNELPYLDVPFHSVVCLTPTPFGCKEERYEIDIEAAERGVPVFWTKKELFHLWD